MSLRSLAAAAAALLLLVSGACTQKPVEYGEALDKLEADQKQAAQKAEHAEAQAAEKVEEVKANPTDKAAQQSASKNLDALVRAYEEQVATLDDDLKVLETGGEATLKKIANRIGRIQDETIRATETQRLNNARAKLNRDVKAARVRIDSVRVSLSQAKDLVLVAQNSDDLRRVVAVSRDIFELSGKTKALLASISDFTHNRDLLASVD